MADIDNNEKNLLSQWIDGEIDPFSDKFELKHKLRSKRAKNRATERKEEIHVYVENEAEVLRDKQIRNFGVFYKIVSIAACLSLLAFLLITVMYLPKFGEADNPVNNEVSQRYIEQGQEETGAVNIVAGMILDYRAFDTFGESCVLFIASSCVFIMLSIGDNKVDMRRRKREIELDHMYEPRFDIILRMMAKIVVPIVFIFGIYIILNGHLSPGGGFSGGAVIGAGLILYMSAFGYDNMKKVFNEKRVKVLTFISLTFYCLAKSYSFFTGANHLESIITQGTPGRIISAGLILPLNICVGIIVACTMYAFFTLFRKGEI